MLQIAMHIIVIIMVEVLIIMVTWRTILQPAAQQLERVQCDGYVVYVLGRRILQPAAPRSLVPL